MAHEKLTDRNQLTTPVDGDKMHIVDVSDNATDAAGNSKYITVSDLMTKAPVQTVNGATGTVVLEVNDLDNVNASSPSDNDVLSWDSATSKYLADGRLSTLYTNLKEGVSSTINDGANTNSQLELTGTTSRLKTGITGIEITETSPGDVEFVVATDASGTTAYTAIHLDGTTTANIADLLLKVGTQLKLENSNSVYSYIRNHPSNTQNTTITLPQGNVTLASTADVTNLGNANLTANANRTYDIDGNQLTVQLTSGDFLIQDGATTRIEVNPLEVQINSLSYPSTDGTNGQVLTTDGSGNLSFTTVSGGGGTPLASADQTLTGDRLIDTNGYNLEIELDPTGTADTFTIHDGTHDLFEVNTNTSGTLFSVNDVSGLPTFQSNDDGSAVMPKILTAAPTGTATEGTMQLAIVSGTSYLYVYINGAWRKTTLA